MTAWSSTPTGWTEASLTRYAVLCHGYQNNATGMASYGKHLFDLGYTVLLPDARGHGESEGDYIGMGWPERRDVVRVVSTADRGGPGGRRSCFTASLWALHP